MKTLNVTIKQMHLGSLRKFAISKVPNDKDGIVLIAALARYQALRKLLSPLICTFHNG